MKRLKAENLKAKDLQEEMKKQDQQFKKNLGEMKQASMIIKGSAQGLQDIQEQEVVVFYR